jgi:hypothetical protein
MVPRASYTLTSGSPNTYTFIQQPTKIPFTISFCSECSSVVGKCSENEAFKAVYMIPAGSVDGDEGMMGGKPDAELWTSMRAAWLKDIEAAAQLKGFN